MTSVRSRPPEVEPPRLGGQSELTLSVQNPVRATGVPTRSRVRKILQLILPPASEITVRFADVAEARELNSSYRGRDYATNILSFPYHRDAGSISGDLVLCPEIVEREAKAQNKTLAAHYTHLLVHGALHLQGWDHDNDLDANRMEEHERELLARLGVADPYAQA